MWDRLSEEPSPSKNDCINDVYTMIITDKSWWKYKKYYLDNDFLKKIINNVVNDDSMNSYFDCSLAGYYNFTLPEVKSRCENKFKIRKRRMIKLRGFIKTSGLILLTWKSHMEKMYHPDSNFVSECVIKYNHVFDTIIQDRKPIKIKDGTKVFGILRSNSFS